MDTAEDSDRSYPRGAGWFARGRTRAIAALAAAIRDLGYNRASALNPSSLQSPVPPVISQLQQCAEDQTNWERLSGALRIISGASGLTEPEQKHVICGWIWDHKVDVRLTLSSQETFQPPEVRVSARLKSSDFDWLESRPLGAWVVGVGAGRAEQDVALIELRADQLRSAVDQSVRRFDKPAWEIRELLGLLINPDRSRFGLMTDDALRRAGFLYEHGSGAFTAVLHKLQENLLTAYDKDDQPQDNKDYWIDKTERDLLARAHFKVWAKAAFAIWPELSHARNVEKPGSPDMARTQGPSDSEASGKFIVLEPHSEADEDLSKSDPSTSANRQPKERLGYIPELESYIAHHKHPEYLWQMTNYAIAGKFVEHCRALKGRRKQAPKLPAKRYIEDQIQKIRARGQAKGN